MYGYVYILTNSAFPHLVKIGKTAKDPQLRASQLYQTGTPMPFIAAFHVEVSDMDTVERLVHEKLDSRRSNNSREFFEIKLKDAIDTLEEISLGFQLKSQNTNFYIACIIQNSESKYKFGFSKLSESDILDAIADMYESSVKIEEYYPVKYSTELGPQIKKFFPHILINHEESILDLNFYSIEEISAFIKVTIARNEKLQEASLTEEAKRLRLERLKKMI